MLLAIGSTGLIGGIAVPTRAQAAAPALWYNGQPLAPGATVANPVTVTLTGDNITAGKFYVDGTYLTKISSATPTYTYPAMSLGAHKLKIVPITGSTNLSALEVNLTVSDQLPDPDPTPDPEPNPTPTPTPPSTPGECIPVAPTVMGGGRQVSVTTSEQLKAALADARAGDTITLADGTYHSSTQVGTKYAAFGLNRSGTAEAPITIQGSVNAQMYGGGITASAGLELYGVQHIILKGFTVYGASKGVMLDGSSRVVMDGITVRDTGDEAIHLRAMSSDNVIKNSFIYDAGLQKPKWGEGIYVGSAGDGNWKNFACDKPDTSDRNVIENNTIVRARAESVDIKEGTTGTVVRGNTFIGDQSIPLPAPFGDNSADSWVDVKGNYAIVENNTGLNSLNHGFETHSPVVSWYKNHPEVPRVIWGAHNIFRNNTMDVNNTAAQGNPEYTGGYGFSILNTVWADGQQHQLGNVVMCSNTVSGAIRGMSNIACIP